MVAVEGGLHAAEWKLCWRWGQHVPVRLLTRIPSLVSCYCHLPV